MLAKVDIEELRNTAREAGEAISRHEIAERKKANLKKVGRTYKTRNSYSCPEKSSDYWWVYEKVTHMDGEGFLHTFCFQTDKNGQICVEEDRFAYHMQYGSPIKSAEFGRAWAKVVDRINAQTKMLAR